MEIQNRLQLDNDTSLDDWQAAFWALYGHKTAALPLHDIMLQMVADATRLAEAVRKEELGEALPYVSRVFSWLCNMTHKCGTDPKLRDLGLPSSSLSAIVWDKYPGVCFLCGKKKCICPSLRVDAWSPRKRDREEARVRKMLSDAREHGPRPDSLNSWVDTIVGIYDAVHFTVIQRTLHLFEEIGELEVALRWADLHPSSAADGAVTNRDANLAGELADVFSWLSSICSHVQHALFKAERFLSDFARASGRPPALELPVPSFSDLLVWQFRSADGSFACYKCGSFPCECKMAKFRR